MKIGVIRGQKQPDKRNSVGVSTLLCANWLKNCVCKVIFLLSSYSVTFPNDFGCQMLIIEDYKYYYTAEIKFEKKLFGCTYMEKTNFEQRPKNANLC